MNGLSDVRLTLHSQELEAGQEDSAWNSAMRNAPSGPGAGICSASLHTRKDAENDNDKLKDVGCHASKDEEGLSHSGAGLDTLKCTPVGAPQLHLLILFSRQSQRRSLRSYYRALFIEFLERCPNIPRPTMASENACRGEVMCSTWRQSNRRVRR